MTQLELGSLNIADAGGQMSRIVSDWTRTSVYLHESHVAELLVVTCEQEYNSMKVIAGRSLEHEPGTDHLPFLSMVSTAWAI